jgi:amino acid permease
LPAGAIWSRSIYLGGSVMLFDRVQPLDEILRQLKKKSRHRTLGAFQLTILGIGAIIGTGIFLLTAEAAQKWGGLLPARSRSKGP